jgi:thioredoxin-related protein
MNTPTDEEIQLYQSALSDLEKKQKDKELAFVNGKQTEIDYFHIIENAKLNNKNIFLLFYLENCSGCTVIKYLINYNSEIQEILKDYEVLLINMSKTITSLSNKYNIYTYPSYFIIDASENILKKNTGCLTKNGADNNLINWFKLKPNQPQIKNSCGT